MIVENLRAILTIGFVSALLYIVYVITWRLCWSPLAKFPGPKMAAMSGIYDFYYDVVKEGQYIFEIEKMHKKYGSIVRVTPDELHCNDPELYDQIYAGTKRDKMTWYTDIAPNTLGGASSHEDHRQRRQAFNPPFSRSRVDDFEPVIRQKLRLLCQKLVIKRDQGTVVNLSQIFHAFTVDAQTTFCFGDCWNHLEDEDDAARWLHASDRYVQGAKMLVHVKWLRPLLRSVPQEILRVIAPDLAPLNDFEERVTAQIDKIATQRRKSARRKSLFHHIMQDPYISASPSWRSDLTTEGFIFIAAGAGPASKTLATIIFHLSNRPDILGTLRRELTVFGITPASLDEVSKKLNPLRRNELERMPYLTACIMEGLRLYQGITKRSPRIAVGEDIRLQDLVIPAGVAVSTQSPFMHYNASIFPDPLAFDPQRWMARQEDCDDASAAQGSSQAELAQRHRAMVAFGRGTRMCVGKELALSEIYIALAMLVVTFDFELCETGRGDVDFKRDMFVPAAEKGSLGVRARVKPATLL